MSNYFLDILYRKIKFLQKDFLIYSSTREPLYRLVELRAVVHPGRGEQRRHVPAWAQELIQLNQNLSGQQGYVYYAKFYFWGLIKWVLGKRK